MNLRGGHKVIKVGRNYVLTCNSQQKVKQKIDYASSSLK